MFLATFPAAVLETIVTRLAALFLIGACGDMEAARQAAHQMLGAYHPETEDELCLAAHIVGFSFQTLEALGQAAAPDTPVTRVLRLRGGAVNLSRQAEKAQRRLSQLQKNRLGTPVQPVETRPEPAQPSPEIEAAPDAIQIPVAAKASGQSWTQTYEHRQREARIAASLKRAEARVAAHANAATLGAMPGHQKPTMAQAV